MDKPSCEFEAQVFPSELKLKDTLLHGEGCGVRYVLVPGNVGLGEWLLLGCCRTVGAEPLLAVPLLLDLRRFLRMTVPVRVSMAGVFGTSTSSTTW